MMRSTIQSSPRPQRGLTLVEMMVALTLSLILIAGTLQIFLSSKQAYRTEDALSRIQENGRFALDYLATEVRKTGYTGCMPASALSSVENILNSPGSYGWDFKNMLVGYEATSSTSPGSWSPTFPLTLSPAPVPGTDAITVRFMASDGIDLVPPYSDSAQLFISPASVSAGDLAIGDIAMVTDCKKGSIFQITNLQSSGGKVNVVHSQGSFTPGNSQSLFSNSYGEDAELAVFVTEMFYIGDDTTTGEPALYRVYLQESGGNTAKLSPPQVLADGIQDMQILYGEDTDSDGTANRYVTADNVTSMDDVVSVRIALLARSDEDNVTTAKQTYTFPTVGGTTVTASDRRLRHGFSSTITLRNRVH